MTSLFLFLICLTACLLCIDTTNGLSIHCLTAPIVTALLICWPTGFLHKCIRPFVQFILGECFIVLCIIDCYCQEFFGSSITPQILTNILLSDTRETKEFLTNFIGLHILLRWRIVLLFLLAIILPVLLFCKWQILSPKGKRLRLAGVVFILICLIFEVPTTYKYAQLFLQRHNLENMEGLIFRRYHEGIPTPLHRIVFAYFSSVQSASVLDEIKRSTFSTDIDSCCYRSSHIVLIIGESYNKHHSFLYGYELPTAPLQQKRMDDGGLILFTDAVSPWNITSNAFLDLFSLWEHGNNDSISAFPLFPILFQRAGYTVTFFSNQYLLKGFRKGATNQAGHFFLADNELSDSLFSYRNRKSSKYDLGLVEQVRAYKTNNEQQPYTLDIVHLIGQHFEYSARYPQSQGKFSIRDYSERTLNPEAKQMVMNYDNATRYNDSVLDSLLLLYEADDAIAIFLSDHGEEVYDDLPIHGRLFQEATPSQARQEFEVPMWIWCSYKYRSLHPDIVEQIRAAAQKPFLTDGLPQILLYLAGIESVWYSEKNNLISPNYRCKPRIIGGNVDYDRLLK